MTEEEVKAVENAAAKVAAMMASENDYGQGYEADYHMIETSTETL